MTSLILENDIPGMGVRRVTPRKLPKPASVDIADRVWCDSGPLVLRDHGSGQDTINEKINPKFNAKVLNLSSTGDGVQRPLQQNSKNIELRTPSAFASFLSCWVSNRWDSKFGIAMEPKIFVGKCSGVTPLNNKNESTSFTIPATAKRVAASAWIID